MLPFTSLLVNKTHMSTFSLCNCSLTFYSTGRISGIKQQNGGTKCSNCIIFIMKSPWQFVFLQVSDGHLILKLHSHVRADRSPISSSWGSVHSKRYEWNLQGPREKVSHFQSHCPPFKSSNYSLCPFPIIAPHLLHSPQEGREWRKYNICGTQGCIACVGRE